MNEKFKPIINILIEIQRLSGHSYCEDELDKSVLLAFGMIGSDKIVDKTIIEETTNDKAEIDEIEVAMIFIFLENWAMINKTIFEDTFSTGKERRYFIKLITQILSFRD